MAGKGHDHCGRRGEQTGVSRAERGSSTAQNRPFQFDRYRLAIRSRAAKPKNQKTTKTQKCNKAPATSSWQREADLPFQDPNLWEQSKAAFVGSGGVSRRQRVLVQRAAGAPAGKRRDGVERPCLLNAPMKSGDSGPRHASRCCDQAQAGTAPAEGEEPEQLPDWVNQLWLAGSGRCSACRWMFSHGSSCEPKPNNGSDYWAFNLGAAGWHY